ncbi:CHASE2 domain-containing protein [Baekduia sp. Peel2402]|uniref:CHASE2 domain-containing protein n=1 Tax=Baekduia sp. Peel2402 TaxID=3458296 RepID=UPI00403EA5B2
MDRVRRALIVAVAACAVTGGVAATGILDRAEDATVDERFALRESLDAPGPPPDVVVVGIDDDSFERLDQQWPLPRALHAQAIETLLAAGARRVVYDVQFTEKSDDAAGDAKLLDAAADPRVVLGTTERDADGAPAILPGASDDVQVGFATFPVDGDGVWRDLAARDGADPTLAVLGAGGNANAPTRPIDFTRQMTEVPFASVVEDDLDPDAVRGKVVAVGATATSLRDDHATPVGTIPGVWGHAAAIQTIMDDYPLRKAPLIVGMVLALLAALAAPLATLPGRRDRAVWRALAAGAAGAVLLAALALLAFVAAGEILPLTPALLALALGTAGAVGITYVSESRGRARTRLAFERFVAPAVVDEILRREGGELRLEGRRVEATVLFCDLRGFTTLAETLDAEQVIAVLNRYLDGVSGAIFDHGGTVVSFQGDGVMAVFGAPLEQPDHASRAVAAAREILNNALPEFNTWLTTAVPGAQALDAGIGVNSGPVMSGAVGSEHRIEYAAVGDATNVAARLQAQGQGLLVASTTYNLLATTDAAGFRPGGEVELKGRREAVAVYRPV